VVTGAIRDANCGGQIPVGGNQPWQLEGFNVRPAASSEGATRANNAGLSDRQTPLSGGDVVVPGATGNDNWMVFLHR